MYEHDEQIRKLQEENAELEKEIESFGKEQPDQKPKTKKHDMEL